MTRLQVIDNDIFVSLVDLEKTKLLDNKVSSKKRINSLKVTAFDMLNQYKHNTANYSEIVETNYFTFNDIISELYDSDKSNLIDNDTRASISKELRQLHNTRYPSKHQEVRYEDINMFKGNKQKRLVFPLYFKNEALDIVSKYIDIILNKTDNTKQPEQPITIASFKDFIISKSSPEFYDSYRSMLGGIVSKAYPDKKILHKGNKCHYSFTSKEIQDVKNLLQLEINLLQNKGNNK